MPEEKKTNTPQKPATDAAPKTPEAPDVVSEVTSKINDSHNVLIALSSDPSVDEMSTAIGLSLYLDKLGKRTTAIYSGSTPNALEFLKPEETFESNVGSLQDFIVALNKEKADHLRYKLDGDFVKIYITPYRTRIAKDDLEFSYGDYNVDLVLALNVANGIDLDSALREHGRIMHDATIINITTGNPGKLGEIEWCDKNASSIAEMISKLLYTMGGSVPIEKDEATAFLTGIVAATNRFSNAKTTPECMKLSSRLMESGANQQLISKNITPDVENKFFGLSKMNGLRKEGDAISTADDDATKLDIDHSDEVETESGEKPAKKEVKKEPVDPLLADLKAAEASLSAAGAETLPDSEESPIDIDKQDAFETSTESSAPTEPSTSTEPEISTESESTNESEASDESTESSETTEEPSSTESSMIMEAPEALGPSEQPSEEESTESSESSEEPMQTEGSAQPEKVIQPPADFGASLSAGDDTNKYGQMLEDALKSVGISDAPAAPTPMGVNPAAMNAPAVPTNPEINGVPSINYMPMPGEEVLPPPPTPPIAPAGSTAPMGPITPITPAAPATLPTPAPLGAQPSMQDQVYAPQVNDPGAFKIPGM